MSTAVAASDVRGFCIYAGRNDHWVSSAVEEQRILRIASTYLVTSDWILTRLRSRAVEVHAKAAVVVADGVGLVLGMIEQVEKVKGELHFNPLSNLKVLPEREVYVVAARS